MTQGEPRPTGVPTIVGCPIVHIGYVVDSIPEAVNFWVRCFGSGPFLLLENIHFDELRHPGGPAAWEHSAAFGQWGAIAVELQETSRLEPKATLGPRFSPLNQLNHVAYVAPDLEQESFRLETLGFPKLIEARTGPTEFVIHDAPPMGHTIEVHRESKLIRRFHADLARAADGWSGADPLRPVGGDSRNYPGEWGSVDELSGVTLPSDAGSTTA